MDGKPYNGYSWAQRIKILRAFQRAGPRLAEQMAREPCGLCGDPARAPHEWHSEDYSEPFSFSQPQSYAMCKPCHGRLHKRFGRASEEWELFCRFVEAGGYGREFSNALPVATRRAFQTQLAEGQDVVFPPIRPRVVADDWWRRLTLDPASLEAPWAKPRPLRSRPERHEFDQAFARAELSPIERAILRFHASAPNRTATMRQIATSCLGVTDPRPTNLVYGKLARRTASHLAFQPDTREDGSPVWMSLFAEGWPSAGHDAERHEYRWVMVPAVAEIWRGDGSEVP